MESLPKPWNNDYLPHTLKAKPPPPKSNDHLAAQQRFAPKQRKPRYGHQRNARKMKAQRKKPK
jgi:hypothetical protein